jgi:hypothetical protein
VAAVFQVAVDQTLQADALTGVVGAGPCR